MQSVVICALYQFVTLDDYTALRQPLYSLMQAQQVKGTLLLAREGINGTIAGCQQGIDAVLAWLKADPRLADLTYKTSLHSTVPFCRPRVKLKREIVTLGVAQVDPQKTVGTYVQPRDWNALITDPDVLVVDTRNTYEISIGTFKRAVNPNIKRFRELPQYVQNQLNPAQHKKVAMFCTGGIRCEKATSYLKTQGFAQVYHLAGGILKYLEDVPKQDSLWQGECYVFDNRVSVDHTLQKGQYDMCYGCRLPITAADKQSDHYLAGVSCPHCYDTLSATQRQRFQEREKQMRLAQDRGETHRGADVAATAARRRQAKVALKRAVA